LDPEPSLVLFTAIDIRIVLELTLVVFLLVISAILSAAEVALFSVSSKEVTELAIKKPLTSSLISQLLLHRKRLLATLTVAKYFASLGTIICFLWLFKGHEIQYIGQNLTFVVQLLSISFVLLLFGEILPKVYANSKSLELSQWIIYPIVVIDKIMLPISYPLTKISNYWHEKLGAKKRNFSVNQLSQALELTSTDETSHEEQKILEGIVTFGNTDTKQVMSPRIDLFALEVNEPFAEIYPKIVEKGYSRIPVYKDNIDRIEGVLFVKDLIPHINKKDFDWKKIIREPFFVPENKKLDDLLKDFQSMKSHLAIVVDEYGGTSGIVSLEDVIEEIVGDISDEFDDDDIHYSKIDDKNYIFEGKIDFFRVIDTDESLFEDQKGEAETLAGFILEILGNFPKRRQKIKFENYIFTIESVDNKRIKQIKVTLNE
jgi:putative hemolysin